MVNGRHITYEAACNLIDLYESCMDDYLFIYDMVNDIYRISSQAVERFSIPSNCFTNVMSIHHDLVHPDDIKLFYDDFAKIFNNEKSFHNLQYRWMSKQKEPIWINCKGQIVYEDNKPVFMIGCINEIGKQQSADNVSGLLGILNYQNHFIENRNLANGGFVIHLGIDDFSDINERLGNDYGDMVLRRTANCIQKCMIPGQELFRGTSDEFILVDFNGHDISLALEQYQNIRQTVDQFVEANRYEAFFTLSAGIIPWSDLKHLSFKDLQKISEFSLSTAKKNGKNQYYIFLQEDYDRFVRKRELTKLIKRSINDNYKGFEVYLQPIFNKSKGTVYGGESLARFNCPEMGTVYPSEFIPILEETGLIIPVGKWILHTALATAHNIQTFIPDFRIGINISYIQVIKSNIISEIVDSVRKYDVAPNTIVIELTESGMLDDGTRVIKLWDKLKVHGIHLALDDFGTGCSNFQYLNELRPDIIKIDRSFTLKALENDYEYNLLLLLSQMVHGMNLRMCIEGIETDSELERMNQLSPEYCQGYFFGKPCCVNDFITKYVTSKIA